MQHSGIGGFGKWDGVLILYHSLITKMVYCTALCQPFTRWSQECQRAVHWDPCFFIVFINGLPECIKSAVPSSFLQTTVSAKLQLDPQQILTNFKKISIVPLTGVTLQTSYIFISNHIHFLPKPSFNQDTSVYSNPIKPAHNIRTWESLSQLISTLLNN